MNVVSIINRIFDKGIAGLFVFIVSVVILTNLVSFFLLGFAYGMSILFMTLVFAAVGFCLIKTKLYQKKRFWIAAFVLGLIARILYGFFNQIKLESDMLTCYQSAAALAKGDMSWLNTPYFKLHYPYQIPFVYYEALILSVFKTVRALYIFDALWSVLMCLMVYKIVDKISGNQRIAFITAGLYSWMPSSLLKIGVLYNFSIAGVLLLSGIYCFIIAIEKNKSTDRLKKTGVLLSFAVGILMGLSYLLRQEGIIIPLACGCYYIYLCFSFKKNGEHDLRKQYLIHVLNLIFSIAALTLGFAAITNIADMLVRANGIAANGLSSNLYWQIVCGMTPDENGQFCDKYHWICDIADPVKQKLAFQQIMNEIFSGRSLIDIIWFFIKKIYFMWGVPDSGFGIPFDTMFERAFTIVYLGLDKFLYLFLLCLSLIGVKDNNESKQHIKIFLMIAFIGFFLAYVVKEAGTRYRYDPILMLVLLSSFGMMAMNEKKKMFE